MLGQLPEIIDKNVLVGSANADDAGVYRLTDELAVVLTVDFFTPIVDDPYWFGAISAANALSDVWAMGGRPMAALNLTAFPSESEFMPFLEQMMKGGVEKMHEAGVPVIGGHTIKDKEPKYGFAVMGTIHPDKIYENSMARPGDALVLTKKIGTGVVSTGIKRDLCSEEVISEVTASMAALNKRAAEIMIEVGVSTATDITGFGLLGHTHEVLAASNVQARLSSGSVPFFEAAVKLAKQGVVPAGSRGNVEAYSPYVVHAPEVSEHERLLMNDAQTSGGLLIFVPGHKKDDLVSRLEAEGIMAAHIGEVTGERPEVRDGVRIVVGK